ncbi:MAG: hypothetical protein ACRDHL_02740 [Candidatus Promineifilaceae bacterium]
MNPWLWQGKPWQAFKNFALLFSFAMNLGLLVALILALTHAGPGVRQIATPLVAGLNDSFAAMGEARITRTIAVEDAIPIAFELPVSTQTNATLVQPVPLSVPTTFVFPDGGGQINGTVFLELPAGTSLPVQLAITVPVSQSVPVNMAVGVDIPLSETELGGPFSDLQQLFAPLERLLTHMPADDGQMLERVLGQPAGAADPVSAR